MRLIRHDAALHADLAHPCAASRPGAQAAPTASMPCVSRWSIATTPAPRRSELSGGIGGPVLQMLVWPDHHHHGAWDYGRWNWAQCPGSVLWVGTGVASDALGAFDIAFPTAPASMTNWPRRCAYAIQLDYDGGGSTDLLAEGRLQLTHSVARSVNPVIMLTDPSVPVLTDDAGNAILLDGTTL